MAGDIGAAKATSSAGDFLSGVVCTDSFRYPAAMDWCGWIVLGSVSPFSASSVRATGARGISQHNGEK